MSAAPLPVAAVTAAIQASAGELILGIVDNGDGTVSLVDWPVLGWRLMPGAPSTPVIVDSVLPRSWALIEVNTQHLETGLAGWAIVTATMCDNSFRGGFAELLDFIISATGKGIDLTQLMHGDLQSAVAAWQGARYGGMKF